MAKETTTLDTTAKERAEAALEAHPETKARRPFEARGREFVRLAIAVFGDRDWRKDVRDRLGYHYATIMRYQAGEIEPPLVLMMALQLMTEVPAQVWEPLLLPKPIKIPKPPKPPKPRKAPKRKKSAKSKRKKPSNRPRRNRPARTEN